MSASSYIGERDFNNKLNNQPRGKYPKWYPVETKQTDIPQGVAILRLQKQQKQYWFTIGLIML